MKDYAIKLHINSVGKKKLICIIFSRAILYYDTFILLSILKIKKFHLNNLGNLNFIKYYVMLISTCMINTI